MKFDKELINRVLGETENARIRLEAEAEGRKRKIYSELPRVAELDTELRTTVLDVIRASFGKVCDRKELIEKTRKKNLALQEERNKILSSAGYPLDITEPKYACAICSDTGYAGGELCSCILEKCRKAEVAEINSRLKFKDEDFSDFNLALYPEHGSGNLSPREQMREVFDFCKSYALDFADSTESLYMNGGSGLGKSFLAACIAKEVSKSGFSVVYETAFSILGKYEDVKFGRSEEDTSVYESCDLLIIDDLGCEMPGAFYSAALYNLITVRASDSKKTIVLSTLTADEIKRRYGAPLLSRLEGDFIKLEFSGNDIRKLI